MTRIFAAVVMTTTVVAAVLLARDAAREQTLQRAIDLMESKGDLAKAMPLFEDAARSTDRALAARALLYLGQGQEPQGAGRARATYERIVKDFADQTGTAAVARKRLAAMGGVHSSGTLTKRLVCGECGDGEADFSPDGRLMLMTDWATGDLAVREMSTGQIKRLMAKPGSWQDSKAYAQSPLFSPDLRQIVYLWDFGKKGHAQLRVLANEPGSKPRVLVDNPENGYYEPAAWSPDGKSILVSIEKADRTWQLAWVSAANGSVKILKSLEWRLRADLPMARGRHPSLSPDGRYIAYSALATNPKSATGRIESTDSHIYVLAADGSSETELIKTAGINRSPVWTPDGAHLLFNSDRTGSIGLWSVAVRNGTAGGNPALVTRDVGQFSANAMTHSGSYYYANESLGMENVGIAEAGTAARAAEKLVGLRPTWSPDGKQLAFFRHRPPGGGDNYDLVLHSLESGEETRYSFNGLRIFPPQWFHDGKSILVFVQNTGKSTGWYRVDLASKEFKQILEFDETVLQVGPLSRDEKTIYALGYAKGTIGALVDRIISIELQTGQQKQVCRLPARSDRFRLQLSPDGRTLAIKYQDQETRRAHFARVAIDGSDYREIYTGDAGVFYDHLAWTNDGRRILFGVQQQDKPIIIAIPAEGGKPETASFDLRDASILLNISLSPDGTRLAFSATKRVRELLAIDNLLSVLK